MAIHLVIGQGNHIAVVKTVVRGLASTGPARYLTRKLWPLLNRSELGPSKN